MDSGFRIPVSVRQALQRGSQRPDACMHIGLNLFHLVRKWGKAGFQDFRDFREQSTNLNPFNCVACRPCLTGIAAIR
jgi:hypothetical protein